MSENKQILRKLTAAFSILSAAAGIVMLIVGIIGYTRNTTALSEAFSDGPEEGEFYSGEPPLGSAEYIVNQKNFFGMNRYFYFIYNTDDNGDPAETIVVRADKSFGENFTKAGFRNQNGVGIKGKCRRMSGTLRDFFEDNYGSDSLAGGQFVYIDTYSPRRNMLITAEGALLNIASAMMFCFHSGRLRFRSENQKLAVKNIAFVSVIGAFAVIIPAAVILYL